MTVIAPADHLVLLDKDEGMFPPCGHQSSFAIAQGGRTASAMVVPSPGMYLSILQEAKRMVSPAGNLSDGRPGSGELGGDPALSQVVGAPGDHTPISQETHRMCTPG